MRKFSGRLAIVVTIWTVAAAMFHIYAILAYVKSSVLAPVHLLSLLSVGFLLYPATKTSPRDRPTIPDVLLSIVALACPLYLAIQNSWVEERFYLASPVYNIEAILGFVNMALVIEAVRRMVAPVMAWIIALFVLHVFVGPHLFGILKHPGFPFVRVVEIFYLNRDQGMYGLLTNISATYLITFVVFGAFIAQSSVGDFFNNLAVKVAGKSPGGPAKVAIWGSCFFGMISGMGTANVYTTGTFTIPMMKKYGFTPEFAGGVEATASTGGQYMPPIMGAAAFIMAETLGIPYLKIALYAGISAVLYYVSMSMAIHFKARKAGMGAWKDMDNIVIPLRTLFVKSYNLLPLFLIVGLMVAGFSPCFSALFAMLSVVLGSYIEKGNRMTFRKILIALESGVKNTVMVAAACAGAGIIVSSISHTAFGVSFVSLILNLSQGHLFLAIVLTAFLALILGVGMPTTPAYILAASLAAPLLVEFGVDVVAAHLFVFYFAKISEVTPPVAICAYAAASIADSDPFKTGVQASKLATSGYILPVAFLYNTALILKGTLMEIVISTLAAIVGLWFVNAALEGWAFRNLNIGLRVLAAVLGIMCFFKDPYIMATGSVLGIMSYIILKMLEKRDARKTELAVG